MHLFDAIDVSIFRFFPGFWCKFSKFKVLFRFFEQKLKFQVFQVEWPPWYWPPIYPMMWDWMILLVVRNKSTSNNLVKCLLQGSIIPLVFQKQFSVWFSRSLRNVFVKCLSDARQTSNKILLSQIFSILLEKGRSKVFLLLELSLSSNSVFKLLIQQRLVQRLFPLKKTIKFLISVHQLMICVTLCTD